MRVVTEERYGPVVALQQSRAFWHGSALSSVRCYAVDGLLVDTGMAPRHDEVRAWAERQGVRSVVLTHHHEDHSGNAAAFAARGHPVAASPQALAPLATGFHQRLYQSLIWGRPRPVEASPLPPVVETNHHRFHVIEAPGHSPDLVVFHEAREGWLFSGDAFLGERIRLFRRDEDFDETVRTLERLSRLDFDSLFCAHRPRPRGGKEALQAKLSYLVELGERVRADWAAGLSVGAILRRHLVGEDRLMWYLTGGDVGHRHLIESILFGRKKRPREPRSWDEHREER